MRSRLPSLVVHCIILYVRFPQVIVIIVYYSLYVIGDLIILILVSKVSVSVLSYVCSGLAGATDKRQTSDLVEIRLIYITNNKLQGIPLTQSNNFGVMSEV